MSDIDLKQLRALTTALRKYETGESQSAPIKEARETVTTELVLQLLTRLERAERALAKISDIRDSIVGMQGFNFSEHAYPLVAALDAAGFTGKGYEISRANLGTLLEQRDAAIERAERAERERDDAVVLLGAARSLAKQREAGESDSREYAALVTAQRDAAVAELANAKLWNEGLGTECDSLREDLRTAERQLAEVRAELTDVREHFAQHRVETPTLVAASSSSTLVTPAA